MSNETMTLKVIAHIHTAFPTKFGIPRQSGLVDGLRGEIIFTPEYRNADALRGLEDFSHIWLVWQFSGAVRENWSPTVRPPRLGGNTRMGVFATRSPFRPFLYPHGWHRYYYLRPANFLLHSHNLHKPVLTPKASASSCRLTN